MKTGRPPFFWGSMSHRTARRAFVAGLTVVVLVSGLGAAAAVPKKKPPPNLAGPAPSTGIGGTARYGEGEWVHQDFVYDDEEEADNAADVVEVRVRAEGDDLVIGTVLNTLRPSDATVVGLAIGRPDGESAPWPNGAAVASPWDRFVTVVPGESSAVDTAAADGSSTTLAAPSVDYATNSITVRVPAAATTGGVLRLNGGAGLWEAGAWASDPGIVDLFFNRDDLEPKGSNFRSGAQTEAVESGDVSTFFQDVDLARLAAGPVDPLVFTAPGTHNAVFKSRQDLGEGYGEDFPKYNGLYQPYALWLPEGLDPQQATPLVLVLHSLLNHHNQYSRTVYPQVAGSLGAIAITPLAVGVDGWYWDEALVDTLDAWADVRGRYAIDAERTFSSGYSMGGYGTYRLATILPDLLTAGISWVGPPTDGIWTGSPTTEDPGLTYHQLENTYHVPFFIVHGTFDELVPVTGVTRQAERFKELGHEYRYNLHPGQDHLSFAIIDDWSREQQWVQGRSRVVDPARVTFKSRPATWAGRDDDVTAERRAAVLGHLDALTAELGGSAIDSAYWVRDVVVAGHDPVGWNDVTGFVDLTSHAVADRVPVTRDATGAAAFGSSPHVITGLDRFFVADPVSAPVENALSGTISGVSELTVDLPQAGLRLQGLDLSRVQTDVDVTLHLVEGNRSRTVVLTAA